MPLNPRSITAPTTPHMSPGPEVCHHATEIMFNMTWRSLSHTAVPKMLPSGGLDENGSIPRAFCPEVYDGVVCIFLIRFAINRRERGGREGGRGERRLTARQKNIVTDMGDEAQYAVWYWVVPPAPSSTEEQQASVGWHPCFSAPVNRYVLLPSSSYTSQQTGPLSLDIPSLHFIPLSITRS
jgi:hypothetical protein